MAEILFKVKLNPNYTLLKICLKHADLNLSLFQVFKLFHLQFCQGHLKMEGPGWSSGLGS